MTATRIHNSLSELGEGISGTTDDTALSLVGVSNAVNYIELTNSATGSEPILSAAGSDTDIDIILTPKGSGQIIASSIILGALAGNATTATTAGIVTTAAQPNITSVGTLSGFTSTGIDDNATSIKLNLTDSEASFAEGVRAGYDGTTYSTGLSGFYAYDTDATNYSFIRGRDSAGTGAWLMHVIGSVAKFQVDSDGDISVVRNITSSGNLSCNGFASTGIDDNSTAERLQVADSNLILGDAATSATYSIYRGRTDASLGLSGGSTSALGANLLMYSETNTTRPSEWRFRQSGVERITIDDTTNGGDIILRDNAAAIVFTVDGAAGHAYAANGIRIGADAAANLLDDYEEGTFTPIFADETTGGNSATGTNIKGRYTKVGRMVHIAITASNIVTAGMTGANTLSIQGLPFTTISSSGFNQTGNIYSSHVTFADQLCPYVGQNKIYSQIRNIVSAGGGALLKVQDLNSGSADIYIQITYEAA